MNIADITQSLIGVLKLLFLTLDALFIAFSFVMVRQVQLMTRVLTVPIAREIRLIALGILFIAIGVFITSLVVL